MGDKIVSYKISNIFTISDSPIIEVLKLGDGKLNEVVEIDPLHLECDARANPPVEKFMWYFNVSRTYDIVIVL